MGIKKNISIFICLFLVCLGCSKAPESSTANPSTSGIKLYGDRYGEILRSFEETADGGYMFGGYTSTSANQGQQGFIQKCDKNGNLAWYKNYGGVYQDVFQVVRSTSDGGFIAAGSSNSFAANNNFTQAGYLVKTNSYGNLIWQKPFANKYTLEFYDVTETPDNGFVAVGFVYAPIGMDDPVYIVKTDQNGDSLWGHQIILPKNQSLGASLAVGPNGEIAVAGLAERDDSGSVNYPTFTYFSPTGTKKLQKTYTNFGSLPWVNNGNNGTTAWDYLSTTPSNFEKIVSRPDGFIFIMLSAPQDLPSYPPCATCGICLSMTIFKIDFNGNILWHNSFPGMGNGVTFNDAINNQNGGLLVSGSAMDGSGNSTCWILNTDANGNKTQESFTEVNGSTSQAVGAANIGNSFVLGVNSQPLLLNSVGFFGFLTTDQNGKIIDESK